MSSTIHSQCYPNGLVLVAEPMPAVQSAAFTFLLPTGNVFDPADRNGLANFACELALRGAGERDNRQFILDLDNLGLERSETVSDAHTAFCGATVTENLSEALRIYADLVRRPHLPDAHLESSRMVVLQELRAVEDEPAQRVMVEVRRRHYPDPWGRPSHGEREALEVITADEIRRFAARHYQPAGAILGVAGRVDWAALTDLVGALFGDWQPNPPAAIIEKAPNARQQHLPFHANQTQIGLAYASVPYNHPDYFQAWSAVQVLSGGASSRLFNEVREKRGLCYSVYATYHTLRDRGGVFCYAGTSAERAQETLDVTLAELLRLAEGIEVRELDRLKARIKSALIMQQESTAARSGAIARDWYHLGRVRTLAEVGSRIDALTPESINAYLAAHPPHDFTLVTLGPEPLEVPLGV